MSGDKPAPFDPALLVEEIHHLRNQLNIESGRRQNTEVRLEYVLTALASLHARWCRLVAIRLDEDHEADDLVMCATEVADLLRQHQKPEPVR